MVGKKSETTLSQIEELNLLPTAIKTPPPRTMTSQVTVSILPINIIIRNIEQLTVVNTVVQPCLS
jgi:hypothetical protein